MKKLLVSVLMLSSVSVLSNAEEIPNKMYFLEDIEENYIENPFAIFMRADKILRSENPDYKTGLELLEKASKLGIHEATHNIGNMYYFGIGVEKNYDKAMEYLYIASKNDVLESQLLLADIYARKKINLKEAFKWYYIAAKRGVPEAKYYVANMLFYGKGTFMDTNLGIKLLKETAEETSNKKIYFELGEIFSKGINNPRDYESGLENYEKSANLGHVMAQRLTADMYQYGKGTKRNLEKALYWYTKAALNGDVFSMARVGDLNLYGEGTNQNTNDAIEWYKKASKYNNNHSLYQLASIYMKNKNGIEPNYKLAIDYYKKAVNAGNKEAMRELAIIYRKGLDGVVEQDNFKYQDLMKLYYVDVEKKEKEEFNIFNFNDEDELKENNFLKESFEVFLKEYDKIKIK